MKLLTSKLLSKMANRKAKIRFVEKDSGLNFEKFCNTLNKINSLGRDEVFVTNRWRLSDYVFPVLYKEFVYPNSVSFDGTRGSIDLVKRPEWGKDLGDDDVFTPAEMRDFVDYLYKLQRATAETVQLESLRTDDILNQSLESRIVYNNTASSEPTGAYVQLTVDLFTQTVAHPYDVTDAVEIFLSDRYDRIGRSKPIEDKE